MAKAKRHAAAFEAKGALAARRAIAGLAVAMVVVLISMEGLLLA